MIALAEACGGRWFAVPDGDPRAFAIQQRHYSARSRRGLVTYRQRKIAGPGASLVLLTPLLDGLFIWRAERFRKDGQVGINCAVFRNESAWRSSDLIREACALAWTRWPGERLYTFVDAGAIRSTNPGYCFQRAGWRKCGRSGAGLVILEYVVKARESVLSRLE